MFLKAILQIFILLLDIPLPVARVLLCRSKFDTVPFRILLRNAFSSKYR